MQASIQKLLKELDIPFRVVEHPAVFTVAEAAQHIKDKRPIKNLLLEEKGGKRQYLVIMAGEDRLDIKSLALKLGSEKLHFASAETLMQSLGVDPGSVSLFGLLHRNSSHVQVVLDKKLLGEPELGFHPNMNTSTIFIPGQALSKIIQHTGHKWHPLDL